MTERADDRAMLERLEGLDLFEAKAAVAKCLIKDDAGCDATEALRTLPRLLGLARRGLEAEERATDGMLDRLSLQGGSLVRDLRAEVARLRAALADRDAAIAGLRRAHADTKARAWDTVSRKNAIIAALTDPPAPVVVGRDSEHA